MTTGRISLAFSFFTFSDPLVGRLAHNPVEFLEVVSVTPA